MFYMQSAFEIDPRVSISLDFDLALRIGEFIVRSGTVDKQIMAFGHRLLSIEDKEEPKKWIPRPNRQRIVRSEGEDFAEGLC
jgi:hypothetical protein